MNVSVLISTFLAATIEVIEMVAIVVAVGVTRSWRAARLVRAHAVRRVGGLTGDVLGGLSEVATTAALLVLSLGA